MSGHSSSSTESWAAGEAITRSRSETLGYSEAFESIFADLPTQLWQLDELIHKGIVAIRSIPDRNALVYQRGDRPFAIRTFDVQPGFALRRQVEKAVRVCHERSEFSTPSKQVARTISERAVMVSPMLSGWTPTSDC